MKLVYVYVAIKGQLHPNLHDRKDPAVSEWIIVQRLISVPFAGSASQHLLNTFHSSDWSFPVQFYNYYCV